VEDRRRRVRGLRAARLLELATPSLLLHRPTVAPIIEAGEAIVGHGRRGGRCRRGTAAEALLAAAPVPLGGGPLLRELGLAIVLRRCEAVPARYLAALAAPALLPLRDDEVPLRAVEELFLFFLHDVLLLSSYPPMGEELVAGVAAEAFAGGIVAEPLAGPVSDGYCIARRWQQWATALAAEHPLATQRQRRRRRWPRFARGARAPCVAPPAAPGGFVCGPHRPWQGEADVAIELHGFVLICAAEALILAAPELLVLVPHVGSMGEPLLAVVWQIARGKVARDYACGGAMAEAEQHQQ